MLAARNILRENEEKLAVFPTTETIHNCSNFAVLTAEEEMVCVRCGAVCEEAMQEYLYENGVDEDNGRHLTSNDHQTGNGLFSSQTIQQAYISRRNPGQAFILGGTSKDFQGKKTKKQLRDGYHTGIIADPTRGVHVETDILTGKNHLKFSRYDAPLLPKIQQEALQRCVGYGLDVVNQTLVSKDIKRVYSHICMALMPRYITLAALLNNRHLLPKSAAAELEKEMATCIEQLRDKILSGCAAQKNY